MTEPLDKPGGADGPIGRLIGWCLHNKLLVGIAVLLVLGLAWAVCPFDWSLGPLVGIDPVPVDAIPDIGENQQIVFTEWPGISPDQVDEQLTIPLTQALAGLKDVRTIRSTSMLGFSTVYVIFDESADYFESRTRLDEKLRTLVPGRDYPEGVSPRLGPDATALGQVYWYTLEGRDGRGEPTGGWDLAELRSVQDWHVRFALASVPGVSEVAGIGGHVREYQVNLDPDKMDHFGVTLADVTGAIRASNVDVSAKTLELNRVEYFVRGIGLIQNVDDLQQAVVAIVDDAPIRLDQVASVSLGPAHRRGALDKDGAEAVGGVVVARFGENPLQVIGAVKRRIADVTASLPRKVLIDYDRIDPDDVRAYAGRHDIATTSAGTIDREALLAHLEALPETQRPSWATISQVTIVPFYDRTGLIHETLGTLEDALRNEILITFIVVLLMVMHLRSSALIGGMLPLAVALTFIAMRTFGVDANIVALSGIAIAVGTIVDMGIVLCENILRHLDEAASDESRWTIVHRACTEVGGAVLAAVLTTVVGFLPVFAMTGAAGKLFRPLAFTKTFALIASILVALLVIPPAAYLIFRRRRAEDDRRASFRRRARLALYVATVAVGGLLLVGSWMPLGPTRGFIRNLLFVGLLIGALIAAFRLFQWKYPVILAWCLAHKKRFLAIPLMLLLMAGFVWVGFDSAAAPLPTLLGVYDWASKTNLWAWGTGVFPGLGREFMPALDEGSFLWMPTMGTHASLDAALEVLSNQDRAIRAVPEVEMVVGKIGRVDSALDPAPLSMIETVITYRPEYAEVDGQWVRQWRDDIHGPGDIWSAIKQAGRVPGANVPSKLQPIETRLVMLQTGMRGKIGIKITGRTQAQTEAVAEQVRRVLTAVPSVRPETIYVDRLSDKPYVIVDTTTPDAQAAMAHHGLNKGDVLSAMSAAIGGQRITSAIEGPERYAVRVRYHRQRRDSVEAINQTLITTPSGQRVPLRELATVDWALGPQAIKSEDTLKVTYVTFEAADGAAEVDVASDCRAALDAARADGRLGMPAGAGYALAGSFENEQQASRRLRIIVPVALALILLILYTQFRSFSTAMLVFSGVAVAFAGGFLLLWLYGRSWFLGVHLFGMSMQELFQVHSINLSTAIWVGFLALFGIATDDGVIMATYLDQTFRERLPANVEQVRQAVLHAGTRRVRACLMTTATTVLALLPVLTSQGRGSDIMVPMALPSFGGMAIEVLTMLVVPVLYCALRERRLPRETAGHG